MNSIAEIIDLAESQIDDENDEYGKMWGEVKKTLSVVKGLRFKNLTKDDVSISIECLEENVPIKGNVIVSGDDEYDKEVEKKVARRLRYNSWAWCCVRVTAKWNSFEGETYLGCCSYKNEKDFMADGYYEQMVVEALSQLNNEIKNWLKG